MASFCGNGFGCACGREQCDDNCPTYRNYRQMPSYIVEHRSTTNYDRIIGKTPEELAEWIESIEPAACPWRDDHGDNCCFTHCHDCWLDWLKQEATEWKVGPIASIVSEKTIRRSGSSG